MKTNSILMTTPDQVLQYLSVNAWVFAFAGLVCVAVALAILVVFVARRWQRQRAEEAATAKALRADLGALSAIIAGLGSRLVRIEQHLHGVSERQDQLELRPGGERSYSHAIRMVHKGADVDELVASCGMNRGEAELLLRVHGMAQAS